MSDIRYFYDTKLTVLSSVEVVTPIGTYNSLTVVSKDQTIPFTIAEPLCDGSGYVTKARRKKKK